MNRVGLMGLVVLGGAMGFVLATAVGRQRALIGTRKPVSLAYSPRSQLG